MNFKISNIKNIFFLSKFDKDSVWLFFAQIILALSGIIINIIIGNKYGSEVLGIFNQSISIFFLFSALISLGLNNSTIKKISEDPNNYNRNNLIVNSNLIASTVISFFVCATVFFTIDYFKYIFSSPEIASALKIIFISVPIYNFNKILMSSRKPTKNAEKLMKM